MKKSLFLSLILFSLILSACGLTDKANNLQKDTTTQKVSPLLSSEERLTAFLSMGDVFFSCDPLKVGEEVCKARKALLGLPLSSQKTGLLLSYGDELHIDGFSFNLSKDSLLHLKSHTGALEVKITSLKNRSSAELQEIKKGGIVK